MKAKERHQLKQNEFAQTAAHVADVLQENRRRYLTIVIAVVIVAVVAGSVFTWRKSQSDRAGALLGKAIGITEAQIAPPSTLPGAPQQAGTYPTEQARDEAALKALQEVATTYPSSDAALAASYLMGTRLVALGRASEAEQAFKKAADSGSGVYGPSARLGLAQALLAQKKNDEAIKLLTDIASERDGALPVDGVLMQLARACEQAGKSQDARAAYKRVTDEFPDSKYVTEARQQLSALN